MMEMKKEGRKYTEKNILIISQMKMSSTLFVYSVIICLEYSYFFLNSILQFLQQKYSNSS